MDAHLGTCKAVMQLCVLFHDAVCHVVPTVKNIYCMYYEWGVTGQKDDGYRDQQLYLCRSQLTYSPWPMSLK